MAASRREALRALAGSIAAAFATAGTSSCNASRSDGRIEGSLWFAYGGLNREVLLALIGQFHASQSRYRIHATYQGDYFEALAKLRTAISAGAAPALTHVVGEVVPYLAEAGVLSPLDAFAHTSPLDFVAELAQAKGFRGGDSRPLLALPFNRSTPIAYYNTRVFDELGLSPPTTWEALRAVAQRATQRGLSGTVSRWGFVCPVDWWFWIALVGQAGGSIVGDDGSLLLGGEAGVTALEFWQHLVHEDRTMKPPTGRDYAGWGMANTDLLSGRAAMIWNSTAYLRYLEQNANFKLGVAPLPRGVRASVPTGGTFFVMPKGAPRHEQEAAGAFLTWMMEPVQANAWATRTGYIPVSRAGIAELTSAGYYRDHPNDRVALDQVAVAEPWPWAPELFRIQREAVQPRLEKAILARRDPRAMLDEARRAALMP